MIHEVDAALRTLVEREALGGSDIDVAFDAPTKDWAARRNQPTIDVYLYDVRQDVSRRQFGVVESVEDGVVTGRGPGPTYFRLSYLLTAWTQRPEDEHRLLAGLLTTLLRHAVLPRDLLTGSLAELGVSIPLTVALPPPQDRSLSDVWSALGGELKPSIDVNVVAPLLPDSRQAAGPPVRREPVIRLGGRSLAGAASGREAEEVGGRPVADASADGPVEAAVVEEVRARPPRRPAPAADDARRAPPEPPPRPREPAGRGAKSATRRRRG